MCGLWQAVLLMMLAGVINGTPVPVDDFWKALHDLTGNEEAAKHFLTSGRLPSESMHSHQKASFPIQTTVFQQHTHQDSLQGLEPVLDGSATTPLRTPSSNDIESQQPALLHDHISLGSIGINGQPRSALLASQILAPKPLSSEQRIQMLEEARQFFDGKGRKPVIKHPFLAGSMPPGLVAAFANSRRYLRQLKPDLYVTLLDKEATTEAGRVEGGMSAERPSTHHVYVWKYTPVQGTDISFYQLIGMLETGLANRQAAKNLPEIVNTRRTMAVSGPDSIMHVYRASFESV